MELGQKIRQARLEAGLSQRQLCGDTITRNMLSQIENGTARPSMDTLRYLAARLDKNVGYFLGEESVSPNQALLSAARTAYAAGAYRAALEELQNYSAPDPVFDPEQGLLRLHCLLCLAEESIGAGKLPYARQLLDQAQHISTPYCTPELERRRQLLLSQAAPELCPVIAQALPQDDRELLLRARAALAEGDPARCIRFLDAVCHQSDADWCILRGDAAAASRQYAQAIRFYRQAEPIAPRQVYPKLEKCCEQLEDYKMAYYYACKQR